MRLRYSVYAYGFSYYETYLACYVTDIQVRSNLGGGPSTTLRTFPYAVALCSSSTNNIHFSAHPPPRYQIAPKR